MVDWFKHFFNFPRNHEGISDHFQENIGIDGEEERYREDFGSFPHHHPFAGTSDMFRNFEEIFKHFESMFHDFGHEDFPLPSIEHHIEEKKEHNLRDKMLKIPDSNSSIDQRENSLFGGWTKEPKVMDTDLDAKVAKEPLDQIIPEISPKRPSFFDSFNSSVSVRISSVDGKIEEHRTVKDSDGNINVTVRRSLGDQTHVVTTKSDSSGQSEKTEEFINMDEESLNDFEKKWKAPKLLPLPGNEDPTGSPRDEVLQGKKSSCFDIIGRLFGRNPIC